MPTACVRQTRRVNSPGFSLPELVISVLVSAVLIGTYVGACDWNQRMERALVERPCCHASPSAHLRMRDGWRAKVYPRESAAFADHLSRRGHVDGEPAQTQTIVVEALTEEVPRERAGSSDAGDTRATQSE